MWDRIEMKRRGKLAFQKNYASAVVAALIMVIFANLFDVDGLQVTLHIGPFLSYGPYVTMHHLALILASLALAFAIFVGNVLEVSGCLFFIRNQTENPKINVLLEPFKSEYYANIIVTQLIMKIKLVLWTLLFIVPGIVKMYEYRMIPYLLAEDPGLDHKKAFAISREMMYGHKWDLFVMDLSFIGWELLSAFTLGIAGLLFVNPYVSASQAEVYAYNKWVYFNKRNGGTESTQEAQM